MRSPFEWVAYYTYNIDGKGKAEVMGPHPWTKTTVDDWYAPKIVPEIKLLDGTVPDVAPYNPDPSDSVWLVPRFVFDGDIDG